MSLKYLKLKIDNQELDIDADSDFPIVFDYQLEDVQDFQKKKSSESIGMRVPATLNNQKILNTFQNTAVEDYTPSKTFKSIRNIVAEANGIEIFVGKAIPKRATKRGGVPISFELNCFGNNGDWMINLKETTLYDLVKKISFTFDKPTIEASWNFDGTNESLPYVFAPVKYAGWMDVDNSVDTNYSIKTMKPSLSIYWILYWGFKSVGYQIKSDFFNTSYFRRLTMLWTYGAFLSSEGTKYDIHRFLAKSTQDFYIGNHYINRIVDLNVKDNTDTGCFDNNNTITGGDYFGNTVNGGGDYMKWKYNTPHYGTLEATFSISLSYDYKLDQSSEMHLDIFWYKKEAITGVVTNIQNNQIFDVTAPLVGASQDANIANIWCSVTVNPDDEVWCCVYLYTHPSKNYTVCRVILNVLEFKLDYFKIPIGGMVNFDSYLTFQKHKFLDYLKGVIDLFNLSIQTDPINKIVLIEPTHEHSLDNDLTNKQDGYFTKNTLDFTDIEDISQDSTIELYDDNAREFVFKFKDDTNDGALKIVQDRYKITLASGKYVFSERFKAEKTEFENRFFSPTMHYLVDDFSVITGVTPQMICLVPENISNTSSSEAQNTFLPKIAYYKGIVSGVGGWKWDGVAKTNLPYMFAVNYKNGGENDPVLSYTDEKIGATTPFVIGKSLLKRFFWQRLAIMNNGQWLNTQFMLNNKHITNWFHRERININGELWELISIKAFNTLSNKSTKCILRKWIPISESQLKNTYPSETSVLTNAIQVLVAPSTVDTNVIDTIFDTQYNRLMCLYNDIPKQ